MFVVPSFLTLILFQALVALLVFFLLTRFFRRSPVSKPKLDKAGVVTNALLAIFYFPMSFLGSLMGMAGEGYMLDSPTLLQTVLCEAILWLGFFTFGAACGGIAASISLRRSGHSVPSFWAQFFGIGYFLVILLLVFLLTLT